MFTVYIKSAGGTKKYFTEFETEAVGINVFRDDAGNCFIWKSTSAFFNIAEGSQVRLRGAVKEHSDYKGTKQTILQRCKVDAVKL